MLPSNRSGTGRQPCRRPARNCPRRSRPSCGALEGSGHETVEAAQSSLTQASQELEECLAATLVAVEQAQLYVATL